MPERRKAELAGLAVLLAVAAGLRFATIANQSYWFDEVLTVSTVRLPFGIEALGIYEGQAEPPLYFAVAWVWARVVGEGEAALRSLSALAGVTTIPVVYSTARTLAGRRAALIAGAIAAVSPALIDYSQEARSYAFYVLFCAVSFMFVARIGERPTSRRYAGWAIASILAVLAHYLAVFLVVPEALWLALRAHDRRRARIAVAGFAAALAAIVPLALYHAEHGGAEWISNSPFVPRLGLALNFLFVGPWPPGRSANVLELLLLLAGVLVLTRFGREVRAAALLALGAAAAVIALPVAGAVVGRDYVLNRNLLPAVVPLILFLAVVLAIPRLRWVGPGVAAAVCAGLVLVDVRIARSEDVHRDDWRGVSAAVGPPRAGRVVTVLPGWQAIPLGYYRPGLRPIHAPVEATEVVTITYEGPRPRPGPTAQPPPPPPFRQTRTARVQRMTLRWFSSPAPTRIRPPDYRRPDATEGPVPYLEAAGRTGG